MNGPLRTSMLPLEVRSAYIALERDVRAVTVSTQLSWMTPQTDQCSQGSR
jgi:hypothetical protein